MFCNSSKLDLDCNDEIFLKQFLLYNYNNINSEESAMIKKPRYNNLSHTSEVLNEEMNKKIDFAEKMKHEKTKDTIVLDEDIINVNQIHKFDNDVQELGDKFDIE